MLGRRLTLCLLPGLLGSACGRLGFDPEVTDASASGDSGDDGPLGVVRSLDPMGEVEIGAEVYALLARGSRLYVGSTRPGAELAVFDLGDPARPVELGAAATAGTPYGFDLVGDRLYVTTETGGDDLEIFDVSNPAAPKKLGGIPAADSAYRVRVQDARAYVTSESGGDDLEIFDVSDPAAPVKLGGLDLLSSYYVRGIDVAFPLAYTAGQRMNVIDVSDPAAPTILGDGGFYWYAYDLQLEGERVVALESNNSGQPQLRVWDVSAPAAPLLLGAAALWDSYGRDVEVVGPYAFTVCAPGGYEWGAELEVWNIAGDGDPVLVASAHLAHDGHAVAVAGSYVYVGEMKSPDAELRVFVAQ